MESNSSNVFDETYSSLIFFTIAYIIVFITGLIGNIVVLFVIFRNRELKHFTNYFFANLSAADVCVLVFCIPTAIHDIWAKDQWYMGRFFCLINQYIESCSTSVSSLTILAISLERFFAICEPFKVHDIFNETLTLATIFSIWMTGLISSLPFLIYVKYDPYYNPFDSSSNSTVSLVTICHFDASEYYVRVLITLFILLLIFLPFFVLIYIYTRIILELVRHRAIRTMKINRSHSQYEDDVCSFNGIQSINHDQQPSNSFLAYKRFEQKRLSTVIICIITVVFFASQFPVRTIQLLDMHVRVRNHEFMSHLVWIWVWKLSKLLFFVNFTVNPIIYNILSTKFRRSCRRLLQIPHSLSFVADSSRKTSISSYLYLSVSKNRHRSSHLHSNYSQSIYNHHQKINNLRINIENDNRECPTVGNDDVFVPTFQVLNEEDDENTVT